MKEMILKTNELTKKYSGGAGAKQINMTLRKGDIYGFIGQNGAGKTTLLRLITGLIHPTSGNLELFGSSEEQALILARKRIGAMIETPAFFPKMTARGNLEYYRIQRGIKNQNEIERVLKLVNLDATGSKPFNQFSLGMKQRLGLALAIMGEPELLILDEPINGLDPTGMIEFREIIRQLNQEKNLTILISSHILSELTQIATRFGVIHHGVLIKEFSKEELDKNTQGYISMKVSSAVKAGEIIQSTINTAQVEVPSTEEVRLFNFYQDTSQVIELLSANDIKIYSSNEVKINLEDYFIHLIGEIA